ncbi:putative tartan [Operophtera brumata]|uniref:Putative tartan n=1 Tax=Operophtera brumata TaxID=104452 RepID=A0A0L7LPC7_OPEBR|nr:putative tartan [Operophtera brumata]
MGFCVAKWRWWLVVAAWAWGATARTLCPAKCACDDALRAASCANASLEIVPIQLNPEATYINLTHNSITDLLYTFGFYTQLTVLDISYNRIVDLFDKNFENNIEMTHLNLTSNFLKRLDKDTFVGLKGLIDLDLSSNELFDIHQQTFKDLTSLERLDLSSNKLVGFKRDTFEPLTSLKLLSLRNNTILDLPTLNFAYLVHLEFLDMSLNLVQEIPKHGIPYLKELKHLDFNTNVIENIDQLGFHNLPSLRHLDLIPPRLFHGNPKLTHIYMRNNALETLEASHFPIDRLQVLEISGNPFVCNCSLIWLWKLGMESEINNRRSKNTSTILKIDYEDVKCTAPMHLKGVLFIQCPESEFGCSNGWVIVAIVVLTVSIVISVVGGVLYFMGPLKKCKGDKSKTVMTSVMLNGDVSKLGNGLGYSTRSREQENKREVDRYLMIGSSVTNNFHSLNPPWHSVDKNPYYQEDSDEHIYQQFAYETIPAHRTPEKPHIVYV